jgi:ribonuclease Z
MYSQEDEEATKESAHSTTVQAAEIAKQAGAQKLYLIHFSQRYTQPAKLEEEARKIFPESYAAYDLLTVEIPKKW